MKLLPYDKFTNDDSLENLNESVVIIRNNSQLDNKTFKKPLNLIGDEVTIDEDKFNDYISEYELLGGSELAAFIKKHFSKTFTILKLAYLEKSDSWHYKVGSLVDGEWIPENIFGPKKPSYKPKRIERSFESVNESSLTIRTNDDLIKYSNTDDFVLPKCKIGDVVKFNDDVVERFTKENENKTYFPDYISYIKRNMGKELIIDWLVLDKDVHTGNKCWFYVVDGGFFIEEYHFEHKPSYKPRKIIRSFESVNEDYTFFKDNEKLYNFDPEIKLKIGDTVYLKIDALSQHIDNINYSEDDITLDWIKSNISKTFTITEIVYESDDKIWFVNISDYYIYMGAVEHFQPNYRPKRIERSFESLNNEYELNKISIEVKSIEEARRLEEFLSKLITIKNEGLPNRIPTYPNYYIVDSLYDVRETNMSRVCYLSSNPSVQLHKETLPNLPIFQMSELNKVENIIKHGVVNIVPTYKPRKIERTFESNSYKYNSVYIHARNNEEIRDIQIKLFGLGFGWVSGGNRVNFTTRNEFVFLVYITEKLIFYCGAIDNFDASVMHKKYSSDGNIYTIDDWSTKLTHFLNGRDITPSYKPRRIERTFESYKDYKYTEIVVKINSKDDLEKLIEFYSNFTEINNTDVILFKAKTYAYPNYMFFFLDQLQDDNSVYLTFLSERPNNDNIRDCITNRVITDKHIYQMDELKKIENIINHGDPNYGPSYKPKKIERTFESSDRYHYRFKTKQEFKDAIEEEGRNDIGWRDLDPECFFPQDMDYLLGTTLEYNFPDSLTEITIPRQDDSSIWFISRKFLVKVLNAPNYKPRKIERTFENINESYSFIKSEDDMIDFKNVYGYEPKFKIGDKVIFKQNIIEVSDSMPSNWYGLGLEARDVISKSLPFRKEHRITTLAYESKYKYWLACLDNDYYFYIDTIEFNSPSYKPRKIERTLESNKVYPYRFKTEKEFKKFGDDQFDSWRSNYSESDCGFAQKMDYLFGQVYPFDINIDDYSDEYSDDNELPRMECPRTISPRGNWVIKKFMLTSNIPIVPSYKPKKIERTLEAVEVYPYRFKTRKEFEEEFGRGWQGKVRNQWAEDMDYLLGQPYPFTKDDLFGPYYPSMDGWGIGPDMLVPNKTTEPNYKPRKIIRTFEAMEYSEDGPIMCVIKFDSSNDYNDFIIKIIKLYGEHYFDLENELGGSDQRRYGVFIFNQSGETGLNLNYLYYCGDEFYEGGGLADLWGEKCHILPAINSTDIVSFTSILRKCKIYSKYDAAEMYRPRRIERSFESFNSLNEMWDMFKNQDDADKYNSLLKPKYKIGQTVRLKRNALDIHINKIHYSVDVETEEWIKNHLNDTKLKIVQCGYEDDLNYWIYELRAEDDKSTSFYQWWVCEDAIEIGTPTYEPKYIKRSLD